jgi:hypothetical protein
MAVDSRDIIIDLMAAPDAFGPHVTVFRLLGTTADERAWLGALPERVRHLDQLWGVETERPYVGGSSSWVAPGTTKDGAAVVWGSPVQRTARAGLAVSETQLDWHIGVTGDRTSTLVRFIRPGAVLVGRARARHRSVPH